MTKEAATSIRASFDEGIRRALGLGALACACALTGAFLDRQRFMQSYLQSFLFWISFPLGSLAIVFLHQLTGGSWGLAIRRLLEAGVRTLPLFALLFLPIALDLPRLYSWARADLVAADEVLHRKAAYLNANFFYARAALFFALWIGLGVALSSMVRRQDRTGDPEMTHRLRMLSGPGLGIYALSVTFASVDWAMSLEPHWFSTVYGVMFIVGQGLATLAFAIVVAAWLFRREPFARWLEPTHFHDLGNLLLAFVMLWAYIAFSQYLIIWSGNLAEETPWYLHRTAHGWQVVALVLIVFHFFVPFLILLSRKAKRVPRFLATLALALIFLRWVDLYWLVAPAFHQDGLRFSWIDIVTPVGMGGVWVAFFLHNLKGRPLISLQDAGLASRLEAGRAGAP